MRLEPADSPQQTNASTILCVGNSWTFGIGAEQPELSYPSQLQRMLAERRPDQHWRSANCGTSTQPPRSPARLSACHP